MPDRESIPASQRRRPWVQLRAAAFRTFVFSKMIQDTSDDAQPGDCVWVYGGRGDCLGRALFNPKSQIALRMLSWDDSDVEETEFWRNAIQRAAALRTQTLHLPDVTNAYRLIHAEGDGLSGLVVDQYADVLSIDVFSLGIWKRIETLLPMLHEAAGTKHHIASVNEKVQSQEGFKAKPICSENLPKEVRIHEHGVRFRVRFDTVHKTGFFCDQRDNRRKLAEWTPGAEVLDLCCNTGGFGVYAGSVGKAKKVTCVDLDEQAIAIAKQNANLNQAKIDTVQADAFTYMRQMQSNERTYDVVVLDPPKFIFGRNDGDEGRFKYSDLNRLGAGLVRDGGVLVTCSCSGALSRDEFIELITGSIRRTGKRIQIVNVSGAAADHPVSTNCPESEYLKVVWMILRDDASGKR